MPSATANRKLITLLVAGMLITGASNSILLSVSSFSNVSLTERNAIRSLVEMAGESH
jgi:ABC-type uncharacterized transport system permease subunit